MTRLEFVWITKYSTAYVLNDFQDF